MDTFWRSWTKAVLWQLLGLATMSGVGVLVTGSWALGGMMALGNGALGLVLYLIYERLWSRVKWGRYG